MTFVRYVGTQKNCRDASYLSALDGKPGHVVLDPSSRRRNITLEFSLDGEPAHVLLPALARDFLDLAACIFVADELVERDATADHWTRRLDFLVPVRDRARWAKNQASLKATLATISGDSFAFKWVERAGVVSAVRHRKQLPRNFDTVCLFSGGIDSLLGANAFLTEGRRVLLVGHQADGTTASSQTRLAASLRKRFGERVSFLQCRVARSLGSDVRHPLPLKEENSHRPRSFLFLALAVVAAVAARAKRVAIPENGLIGLNVPLQRSRFGTLSTRTAHPRFLLGFRQTIASLGLYDGALFNPFLTLSKTDMLADLDPELRNDLLRTVSCAKTGRVRWSGKKGIHHCGFCVPCIYRRVALGVAGLDSSEHYEDDVFRNLPSLAPTRQADFRALVQFAKRVVSGTDAARILSITTHGFFPPEALESIGNGSTHGFASLAAMTLRWSLHFLDYLRTACTPRTRRLLAL